MTGLSLPTEPQPNGAEWRRYIRAVLDAAGSDDRRVVMAAVVQSLARVTGWRVPEELDLGAVDLTTGSVGPQVASIELPDALATAWLPGRVYEALLGPGERRAAGAHYTPQQIATGLITWAMAGGQGLGAGAQVCDPAVGGAAFLLSAAEILRAHGAEPADIVRKALWGIDRDPVAVTVAAAALSHWAWRTGRGVSVTPGCHVVHGDALLGGASVWPAAELPRGFDLVVGNPPFLSQLGRTTARRPQESAALRARFGDAVTGYADSAALFLLAACGMARPGGRVALLQPTSMFATRDTAQARALVLANARLEGIWTAGARVFSANVRVGAVLLEVDPEPVADGELADRDLAPDAVRRATGPGFTALTDMMTTRSELRSATSWSHLITADSTPGVRHAQTSGRLGDIASATAGFRDQYYGLIPFVFDAPTSANPRDPGTPALVTSGMIDPGRCRWGAAPGRFAGQTWLRPMVDAASVRAADTRLGQWLDRVLVPKVVVACQTRVLEAVVDEVGAFVPSVPVIAVIADVERLFDLAAVLLSPWASAWAMRRAAGSALGADAIKLSAKQILDVPLPADADVWSEGAAHLRSNGGGVGDPARFASIMNGAYGLALDDGLAAWWLDRLPVHRP